MKFLLYIIVFAVVLFQSCDKKRDRVFDESPSERLENSVNSAYAALKGNSTGWMIKFFPNSTKEFGGYTIFANFNSDVNVRLEGDFEQVNLRADRRSTDPNSSYLVYPGAGPILTFDTYNSVIHYFSLPGQYLTPSGQIGLIDGGYKGDFEFLVQKITADSIVMQGRKTLNKIVMIPISNSESSTIVQRYKDAVAKFHPLGGYSVEVGSSKIAATFANTITKRAFRITGKTTIFSYRYTPNGLEFYTEYEIEGVKFKELKYVDPTGTYTKGYFTNDAGTIKLVPTT